MSTTWTQQVNPFGGSGNSPGELFENDVLIQENHPALVLNGLESNAVWFEQREVSGDTLLATNAQYITGTGWVQVNPSLASYAWVFQANGQILRVYVPPGASAPLAWVTLVTIDPAGNIVTAGLPLTSSAQKALQLSPTWNAGGAVMTAVLVDVTDTASNALSKLLDLQVGGTSTFTVFKNGNVFFGGTGAVAGNGTVSLPGGVFLKWGAQAAVASDGSINVEIVYPTPFANLTFAFIPVIDTGSMPSGTDLSIQKFAANDPAHPQVHISGGAPGSTVTVGYMAIGY